MITPSFCLRPVCLLVAISAVLCPSLRAAAFNLNPDPLDAQVVRNSAGATSVAAQGDFANRIGEFFAPGGSSYVFPFQLPTLAAGEQFTLASLRFQLFALGNAGNLGNGDLYGLDVRSTANPLPSDYFQGMLDASSTLIQNNFLTPASTVRTSGDTGPFITTNADANARLVAFLNTVDPNNSAAGQFVFFRVNYDLDPIPGGNNFYSLLTANAGGANEKPLLSLTTDITAVPEPAAVVQGMVAIAIAMALAGWRRLRQTA